MNNNGSNRKLEIRFDPFSVFPLSPSPIRIETNCSDVEGAHLLPLNTVEPHDELHLRAPEQEKASA